MPDIDIGLSGPVLDGRADAMAVAYCDEVERDIAAQAYADVMTNLNFSIKHPTPYYETQITTQKLQGSRVVHDRDIVYGPWLEGTSERNRTTRFKGYASFRRARQSLETKIPRIVHYRTEQFIARIS